MPITAHIPLVLKCEMEQLAAEVFPFEACGLLVGYWEPDILHIRSLVSSPNRAENPTQGFEIDAGIQAHLQRELRNTDLHMVGVWHSHPSGDAYPSEVDSLAAFDPDYLWIVTTSGVGGSLTTVHLAPEEIGGPFRSVQLRWL